MRARWHCLGAPYSAPAARRLCVTLALPLVSAVAGCAQVTIHAGDGQVSRHTHAGVVSVETAPGTVPQIVEMRGVGLIGLNGGMTLGYLSSTTTVLPVGDCRIVVWIEAPPTPAAPLSRALAPSLRVLLEARPDICAVGPMTGKTVTLSAEAD